MTDQAWNFLVARDGLARTRIDAVTLTDLAPGEVRLRVESFALTANNVTYAVFGEQIGYWRFFPAPEGWGRVPVWGFGRVEASASPDFAVGERFFGYYPMSTHMTVQPRRTRDGFVDQTPHRADLPAAYNQYQRAEAGAAHEDERSILHPLFMTAFLIDDFLADSGDFGARSVLLTSASSKTAIGLAWCLKRRGQPAAVGLTSPRNRAFTEGLGYYDRTLTYDALADAPVDTPTVLVDFAGDAGVIGAVHRRFGGDLAYSCRVGGTHWQAPPQGGTLPGPTPVFFFAPDRIAKRRQDWGPGGLEARYAEVWPAFIADSADWMRIERHDGPAALTASWLAVLEGRSTPDQGIICQPT